MAHLHDQQYGRKFAFANSGDGVSNLGNSNQFINPYGMDPLLPAFWDKDNLPAYMTELIAQQGDNMFMKNEKGDYVGIPFARQGRGQPAYPLLQQHGRA